jgi:hypothetical protein
MPDTTTLDLILAELRELRSDYNDHARETGERMSALETQLKYNITGNGQPSRLQLLERAVEQLQAWRWRVVGIATGASSTISLIVAWLVRK